jgi:CheY-like chemotaxis protein
MTTLLLVDDDDFVRSALSRALNRTGGFTVLPAEHGRRALDVLAEQPVDAILTDLEMPVMDGLTLLAELFEQDVRLPVAVMTGQAIHTPLRQRLLAYGIAAIFSKPVDVVVLADELQRVLDPKAVGRISGITLFGFLQLLEVESKSGLVVVAASDHEGRLYFDDGQLVHAHTGHLEGLAAVYEILSWPEPAVEIFYKRRARERTVDAPLQHVLMEGARLLDERGRGTSEPVPAPAPERSRRGGLDVRAVRILDEARKIDGALGATVVDAETGVVLAQVGEESPAMAKELVLAALRGTHARQLDDQIEDIMLTLGKQYHVIRFLDGGHERFLHLVLDRERGSLGLARHQLAKLARERR